jgi:phosphoribosylaminoimidazole-succinocarboxamide synthase
MTAATPLVASHLPLPLLRRGKVREMYEVDADTLLMVASDRVSAFDVVMREPVAFKGAVLTQLSAFWLRHLPRPVANHLLTADASEIVARVPVLAPHRHTIAGRAMLVRRTTPIPFECVVRGYLSGSAWVEYQKSGTLAGEPLPPGLVESGKLEPAIFSPATKAESGHDENVTYSHLAQALGTALAEAPTGESRDVRGRLSSLPARHHHRRYQARVGPPRQRADSDRRGPHAGFFTLLAGGSIPTREEPAELR